MLQGTYLTMLPMLQTSISQKEMYLHNEQA